MFLHVFQTNITSVLVVSVRMLQMFSFECSKSRSGAAVSVSYACFKCFICLQTYVASVASGCFKSRSGVASPSSLFCRIGVSSSFGAG
jgi:hypothetical protein